MHVTIEVSLTIPLELVNDIHAEAALKGMTVNQLLSDHMIEAHDGRTLLEAEEAQAACQSHSGPPPWDTLNVISPQEQTSHTLDVPEDRPLGWLPPTP